MKVVLFAALMGAASLAACSKVEQAAETKAETSVEKPAPTPEPVVAAERAFAADSLTMGVKASFLKYSSSDAIMFAQGPTNAHELIGSWPDGPDDTTIVWWPVWAGISQSGDLGFTTGPAKYGDAEPRSYYFTVWAKQPNGSWQWIYDGGPRATGEVPFTQDAPVDYLPLATANSGSAHAAMTEVAAIESELAAAAANGAKAAYEPYLSEHARVTGAGGHPVADRAAVTAELDRRAGAMKLNHLGGTASIAGDFVFTYGSGEWSREGEARTGHYVRIWQKGVDGWRMATETLIATPPPPPPEATPQEN